MYVHNPRVGDQVEYYDYWTERWLPAVVVHENGYRCLLKRTDSKLHLYNDVAHAYDKSYYISDMANFSFDRVRYAKPANTPTTSLGDDT